MFGIQILHIVYINMLQVLTTFTYVRHDTIHRVLWPLSCQPWHHHPQSTLTLTFVLSGMTPPYMVYFDLDLCLVRHDTTIHGVLCPWPLSCQAWHHHLHSTLTLTFVLSGMTLPFTEYFDLCFVKHDTPYMEYFDLDLCLVRHDTTIHGVFWPWPLTFVLSGMTPPSTEYFDLDLCLAGVTLPSMELFLCITVQRKWKIKC